jgi:hypothetical protein
MKSSIKIIGLIGLCIAVPGFSASVCDAIAGNLVQNCGFETGDFTDWTFAGGPADFFSGVYATGAILGIDANSGTYFAALETSGGDGSLGPMVSLTTVPGQAYTFSFWLANTTQGSALVPNDFSADWDGTDVLAFNNAAPMPYTFYTFTETATSTTTHIGFTERNDSGIWGLDDVSVVATGPANAPEPSSMFLLASGLAVMFWGRKALRS